MTEKKIRPKTKEQLLEVPTIEQLDKKAMTKELQAIQDMLEHHSGRLEMFLRELNTISLKEFSRFKQEFINEFFNIHCKKIETFLKDYEQNPMKETRDDNGY